MPDTFFFLSSQPCLFRITPTLLLPSSSTFSTVVVVGGGGDEQFMAFRGHSSPDFCKFVRFFPLHLVFRPAQKVGVRKREKKFFPFIILCVPLPSSSCNYTGKAESRCPSDPSSSVLNIWGRNLGLVPTGYPFCSDPNRNFLSRPHPWVGDKSKRCV